MTDPRGVTLAPTTKVFASMSTPHPLTILAVGLCGDTLPIRRRTGKTEVDPLEVRLQRAKSLVTIRLTESNPSPPGWWPVRIHSNVNPG